MINKLLKVQKYGKVWLNRKSFLEEKLESLVKKVAAIHDLSGIWKSNH
mgnify:CR=1 FL=1